MSHPWLRGVEQVPVTKNSGLLVFKGYCKARKGRGGGLHWYESNCLSFAFNRRCLLGQFKKPLLKKLGSVFRVKKKLVPRVFLAVQSLCLYVLCRPRFCTHKGRSDSQDSIQSFFLFISPLSAHAWSYTPPVGTVAEAASTVPF
jgi:hypothetical protein